MTLDMAEGMGIVPKGTANEFTKLTNEERALVDKEFKKEFGENFGFAAARTGGEILPLMLVPGMGKNAVTRIGGASIAGGVTGAVQYQTDEDIEKRSSDRAMQTGVGMALGGAVGAGMEGLHALKNFVPKIIERVKKTKGDFVAEGVEVQKRTGILFKLSQLTDDPAVENLERLARENTNAERMARTLEDTQPKQALEYFEKIAGKEGKDFGARVERTFQRVMGDVQEGTGLLGKRATQANADFRKAQVAGGKIYLSNTLGTINRLIDEFNVPGAGGTASQLMNELAEIRAKLMAGGEDVSSAFLGVGGAPKAGAMTPLQLQKVLERWGDASKGTGKLFTDKVDRAAEKGPAKALFKALNMDLDDAVEAGGQGAAALRAARDNFAKNTAEITAVRETALGKLFGKAEMPTMEAIESKFMTMGPSEIKAVMGVLKQADPNAEQALQSFWLRRQIESARVPGQAGATEFVPAKLLDMVSGAKGPMKAVTNREMFDSVFTDPKMREEVMTGIRAVQRIMINNYRTSGREVSRLRNLMHVLATRDSGLASRLVTEIFAPEFVTKYVLDPKGVKALSTLAQPYNEARATAALMTLGNIAMRDTPQQPEESPSQ